MKKIISHTGLLEESDFAFERFSSDRITYEVIRVIDGVAIFLEDHFQRLQKSFRTQYQLDFEMNFTEFKIKIEELVLNNRIYTGNIKFVCLNSEGEFEWAFFFIPHVYPENEDYLNGVTTNLLYVERTNPNAKVIQNSVREKANQMIQEHKLYEVLLVNRDRHITEGSRSNVFFVKDEVFYTSPASDVLIGITRQKVMECLIELGFVVIEKSVAFDQIQFYDAAFLTGTSPKVLPVRQIGSQIYSTNLSCVKKLIDLYDDKVFKYILGRKE
jgi:branched-chain amino acid aminotransferase